MAGFENNQFKPTIGWPLHQLGQNRHEGTVRRQVASSFLSPPGKIESEHIVAVGPIG